MSGCISRQAPINKSHSSKKTYISFLYKSKILSKDDLFWQRHENIRLSCSYITHSELLTWQGVELWLLWHAKKWSMINHVGNKMNQSLSYLKDTFVTCTTLLLRWIKKNSNNSIDYADRCLLTHFTFLFLFYLYLFCKLYKLCPF